jgi:hypothetical protein
MGEQGESHLSWSYIWRDDYSDEIWSKSNIRWMLSGLQDQKGKDGRDPERSEK